jgi:hypothetical protein
MVNGELLNATCGRSGNGTIANLTEWVTADAASYGGWGCTGTLINASYCQAEDGGEAVQLFSMAGGLFRTSSPPTLSLLPLLILLLLLLADH